LGFFALNDTPKTKGENSLSPKLTLKKKAIFTGLTILICIVMLESFSSLFLFRYFSVTETAFLPTGPASTYLVEKALKIWPFRTIELIEPSPIYIDDERLGYSSKPGKYRISLSVGSKTYRFSITVPQSGLRATAYRKIEAPLAMYIFGDSFVFGWGNNDEQTMPWLLQQKFPQYEVFNLAQNGYGITQAILQYEQMKSFIKKEDIIILPYADYYLIRNYGAPSFLRANPYKGERRWPAIRSKNDGGWTVNYITMDCNKNSKYCEQKDPDQSVLIEATQRIIGYFSKIPSKVVLMYLNGMDDDKVVSYARQVGMPVVDVRLDRKSPQWDDFLPFDGHPGPIAQYNYFERLARGLTEKHLVEQTKD
jgi:hypothetical protein